MINIIVNGPGDIRLPNPIWGIKEEADYAFVDLQREVCNKLGINPLYFKIQVDGKDMPGGALCLNHLTRGETVDVVPT